MRAMPEMDMINAMVGLLCGMLLHATVLCPGSMRPWSTPQLVRVHNCTPRFQSCRCVTHMLSHVQTCSTKQ